MPVKCPQRHVEKLLIYKRNVSTCVVMLHPGSHDVEHMSDVALHVSQRLVTRAMLMSVGVVKGLAEMQW